MACEQLFGEVPVVPVSTGAPLYEQVPTSSGPSGPVYVESTLDEPLLETIKRDIFRIGKNLRIVLFPFNVGTERNKSLRNWDLWGPLVCCGSLNVYFRAMIGTEAHFLLELHADSDHMFQMSHFTAVHMINYIGIDET